MEVYVGSPLIHLSMQGMAYEPLQTRYRPRARPNNETGFSSIKSLGLKSFVSIAGTVRFVVSGDSWEGHSRGG
jgi:hypothetical protein